MEPGRNGANAPDESLDRELQALRADWKPQADAEPPRELDLAILRKAREAAAEHAPPASGAWHRVWPRVWPWTRSWAHNLATVAVVVLAATLLLQLDLDRDQASAPGAGAAGTHGDAGDSAAEASENGRQPVARAKTEQSPAAPPRAAASETTEPQSSSSLRLLETAPTPRAAPDRARRASAADPDAAQDPEITRRLRELERLREAGDMEAYREALDAFRADFPDHPLPAGLQP